jgi:hypothetical protein
MFFLAFFQEDVKHETEAQYPFEGSPNQYTDIKRTTNDPVQQNANAQREDYSHNNSCKQEKTCRRLSWLLSPEKWSFWPLHIFPLLVIALLAFSVGLIEASKTVNNCLLMKTGKVFFQCVSVYACYVVLRLLIFLMFPSLLK